MVSVTIDVLITQATHWARVSVTGTDVQQLQSAAIHVLLTSAVLPIAQELVTPAQLVWEETLELVQTGGCNASLVRLPVQETLHLTALSHLHALQVSM